MPSIFTGTVGIMPTIVTGSSPILPSTQPALAGAASAVAATSARAVDFHTISAKTNHATASREGWKAPSGDSIGLQGLLQHHELEVVAGGDAEQRIVGRERLSLAGAGVAAPLVPGDQLGADGDDGHAHAPRASLGGVAFRRLQQRTAEPSVLQRRADGEHAEVPGGGARRLQPDAGDDLALRRVASGQDHGVRAHFEVAPKRLRIGALAAEEVRFGGPAGA